MRERLRFLVLYYFFWVFLFFVARIIFLTYHVNESKVLTLEIVFGIFKYGIKMDLATAAFFSIFPFIWVTFSNFISKSIFQNTIFSYTFILLILSNLIIVADLEVYSIWNFRIDTTPLKFLTTAKVAIASIKASPILRLLLSFVILQGIAAVVVYRIIANKIYDWKHIKDFPFIIYGIIATFILIIPIKGGFKPGLLKQNSVFFSDNKFANVSALNAPWNFAYSLLRQSSVKENIYTYLPKEVLNDKLKNLYTKSGKTEFVLSKSNTSNVLLVLVDNLTEKVLDFSFENKPVTPYLNQLKEKSIYFENFYATTDRADKTLLSILSGYPAQPRESIVDYSQKLEKLPFLSKYFNQNNFSTQFYYGGNTDILNLRPYLFAGNFEKIVEKGDFNFDTKMLAMGVPDLQVYQKFLDDHSAVRNRPFFSTILALSSHEPFDVPDSSYYNNTEINGKLFSALHYADSSLEHFIHQAQKETWWNNTLVIILGTRGNKTPLSIYSDNYKAPMFWTGGLIKTPIKIKTTCSQIDLPQTILSQLGLPSSDFTWSRNIFDTKYKPWAFYVFQDGFGYITDKQSVVYDNVGNRLIEPNKYKPATISSIETGKTLMQRTYQYFLDL